MTGRVAPHRVGRLGLDWKLAVAFLAALALLVATCLRPTPASSDGPESGAPWPQLKRDGARTGAATVNGPTVPGGSWSFATGSAIVSGPVIAADGTIYVGTENFRVWAIRPDGTLRWTYVLPDSGGLAPPTYLLIDQKGHIVFGTENGYVVGLETDSKENWRFDTRGAPYGTNEPQAIRAALGASANYGRVYAATDAGLVYELENGAFAGVRRSEADGAIRAGAAVTPDSTLVWGTMGHSLNGGRSAGGDKWRVPLDGAVLATPAVAGDSTTFAATSAGSVYAVTTTGQVLWRVRPGEGRPLRSPLAVGAGGTVYAGSDEGRLYALDPATGATRWSFGTLGPLTAAPAIGADGLIYLGSNDGRLYVLSPTGELRAQFQTDGSIDVSSPAIGANGVLYVGTRAGTLYALKEAPPIAVKGVTSPTPETAGAAVTAPAPEGFSFVRCGSGRVYQLDAGRRLGAYVASPDPIGTAPILQASGTVPQTLIDTLCGPAS